MTLSAHLITVIVSWAAGVGVLWPLFQSLVQKPWWSPRTKAIITVAGAVIFGTAGYVSVQGFDFSDPSRLFGWMLGLYGAIQVGYTALKRPVLDNLETKGNGSSELESAAVPVDDDQVELSDDLPANPYGAAGPLAGADDETVTQ